tara:strand:- start:737 stop:1156 length:420 start_codon:yes stop_codon:yes gene_type:complete
MLIAPWTQNKYFIYFALIIPFLVALFKKYRVLAYLVFLPLGSIHLHQYYQLSKSHYSHFTVTENKKNLILQLTQVLKPNDFQLRFYGSVFKVGDQKTEGKILISINKDSLKQAPNLGDLILTRISPQPILSRSNPGGFD